ncbi:type II toxin-antitoxin system toxin DNA ADP-ribosyl transferase DarT [Methylobacterium aquaticum]|uniref:DarT domain-containing protein n=1 Tax=Methylobacterium aquaticum TaxID=270351 RepID=A0A0J6SGT4_9HYPH|nr:DUF4433 domain-containing protein [Methylobacterium aquaticum]KMO32528.1 hypothetical protein VP06_17350 [Methylobacterium aquaticum]
MIPPRPAIDHITHVDNLPSIIREGQIYADAQIGERGLAPSTIGMEKLKANRRRFPVKCHPQTRVAEYVPFYFCPRSIMLFTLAKRNHAEIGYQGGEASIVHLVADLRRVVRSAEKHERIWAISLSNAASAYAEFRASLDALEEVRWDCVAATEWGGRRDVKDAKAAEFLIHGSFPWAGIHAIGVQNLKVRQRVLAFLEESAHRPSVSIEPHWYYAESGDRHA